MVFGNKPGNTASKAAPAPVRAALYLRVSTGRQAEHDVSLPSQRKLNTDFCDRQSWTVVDEYVEPGLTATDDRRPSFQAMIDRAAIPTTPMMSSFSMRFRAFIATAPEWN